MIDKIKKDLEKMLSPKRYAHTMGVVETAEKLAECFGENKEKVIISALCHDIAKELSLDEMNVLTKRLRLDSVVRNSKSLLHGPAGAVLAKKLYKVNADIYNAIFYHTTGRLKMSLLEKIIFVADMAEPSRNFKDIEKLRDIMFENIDDAVVISASLTISFLLENNKPIYPLTLDARNYILYEKNSGN